MADPSLTAVGTNIYVVGGSDISDEINADTDPEFRPWSRADMRRVLRRWMIFWWLFMPFVMFAPAWNAVHERPDEHGTWIGFLLVAGFVIPLWAYAGWVGRTFLAVLRMNEKTEILNEQAEHAVKVLAVRRADRLARAEARLARIRHDEEVAEQAALQADLVALAEDLSDRDARPADN